MNRHKARENWQNPMSAGSLSRYILWNKPTLRASIADYKTDLIFSKKFNTFIISLFNNISFHILI